MNIARQFSPSDPAYPVVEPAAPGDPGLAVACLRVSKDEQRLGIAAQRAAIESWATTRGVRIVAWHVDRGVSSVAPIAARPGLVAALTGLARHQAGTLVVARRDRLARDVVLCAVVERAVREQGARVWSADGAGNGDCPADRFMRTVCDGAAAYERDLLRARTRAALQAKRAKGERVGAVAYGFALARDGVHLVRASHEQATIARARRLARAGMSLRGIASALAREGRVSRSGRPFLAAQIVRMLAHRA
jgi:site-specific DNA recombinase